MTSVVITNSSMAVVPVTGTDADGNSSTVYVPAFVPVDQTGAVIGSGGGSGTVTSVAALTITTSGTDITSTVATPTTTPVITLNVPTASASNRGALSAADWTAFNSKMTSFSAGTTGFTPSSATSGVVTLAGILAVANGGSGLAGATGSGTQNTAFGASALQSATTGDYNTAYGYHALQAATGGTFNVAVGEGALSSLQGGTSNTAIGAGCLGSNFGDYNTGTGLSTLQSCSTGTQNAAFGNFALGDVTSGAANTSFGFNTGRGITTGSYNVILGASVTGLSSSLSNNIILADGQGNQRINVDATGRVSFAAQINLKGYTVGTLPGSPSVGDMARVTNSLAPAWGVTVASGGSAHAIVWYNNANWTVVGI